MTTPLCAAGIDVGRDFLDVALAPSGRSFRAPNIAKGIDLIVDRLKRAGAQRIVLESIGPYASRLTRALAGAGLHVAVVDPRRIKAWRLAEGKRAKTDKLDAALIARFALRMSDATRPIPSAETQQIRALSARRRQLVEMAAMEKTRLKQALDEDIARSHRQIIATLAQARVEVERDLEARVRASAEADRLTLLQTAPGVGPAIAVTLLADMPELGTLDRRACAALAGVAPIDNASGQRTGRASIGGGRACVRAALYLAALTASRMERGYKREYQAMRAAGKPAKVALIAIARKLVVALNGMARDNKPWSKQAEHD